MTDPLQQSRGGLTRLEIALMPGAAYGLTANLAIPNLIHSGDNTFQFGLAYDTITQGGGL